MTTGILKTTTAVALALSLAAPAPLMAQAELTEEQIQFLLQSDQVPEDLREKLAAGDLTRDDLTQEQRQALKRFLANNGMPIEGAEGEEAEAEADAEAQTDAEAANAGAAAEADADSEAQAEAEAPAAAEAAQSGDGADAAADAAQADTEAGQDPEANAEAEQPAASETPAAPQAAEAADPAAAEGGDAATAEGGDAAAADGGDTGARDAQELEDALRAQQEGGAAAETEAEAANAAEADAETQSTAGSEQQSQADDTSAAPDLESATEAAAAADAAEAEAEAESDGAQAADAAEAETEAEDEQTAETEEVETDAESDATAEAGAQAIAEEDAAAQSAAAASGDTEGAEVIEETVTEENSRSSNEEFETQVDQTQQAEAEAETEADDDDNDDGERAEKVRSILGGAALGALGAVALDRILRPNEEVVTNSGDRIVIERDGEYRVLRNDDALLRRPGSDVTTYRYDDGSTRNVVIREDGTQVETVRAADGRVLRRVRILPSGDEVVLFDDTQEVQDVAVNELPQVQQNQRNFIEVQNTDATALATALTNQSTVDTGRYYSLNQVRNIRQVRSLVPEINVDSINFETGSAVIRPEEAEELSALGNALAQLIEQDPREVFLIEGHTDAVGSDALNLALSDRRAESVALALTEYFDVPPENMVVQGYGESDLLVATDGDERANRRASVRRITPLLTASN